MSVLRKEQRIEILQHLVEGAGIRTTARLCQVSRITVGKLALDLGEGCAVLHDELMRDLRVALVQVDEQWSFVKKKQKRLKETDDLEVMGDQWTYVAQDVVHRAVISFMVAKRTAASARAFVKDLRSRVVGRFQATADGHKPYVEAFAEECGDSVDFAQLVKQYSHDEREARGLRPGAKRYIGSMTQVISGSPDPEHISTSRIERTNLSARMEQARLERKTLRHSKALRQHKAAVALFYTYFNFARLHETLETAPAVALGVTPRQWTLGELIEAALDRRPRVNVDGEAEVEKETELRQQREALQPCLRLIRGGK